MGFSLSVKINLIAFGVNHLWPKNRNTIKQTKKKNKRGDMTGPKLTKLGDVKSINIVNKKEDNFIYNLRIFRLS